MIKLLVNLSLAALGIGVCFSVLYFGVFPRAIARYREIAARRRDYEAEFQRIRQEDESVNPPLRDVGGENVIQFPGPKDPILIAIQREQLSMWVKIVDAGIRNTESEYNTPEFDQYRASVAQFSGSWKKRLGEES